MSNEKESGSITYSDFTDPLLGPGQYTPWKPSDANLIGNAGREFSDIGHGLSSLEALGLKTAGDMIPTAPTAPRLWRQLVDTAANFGSPVFGPMSKAIDAVHPYMPDYHKPDVDWGTVGKAAADSFVGQPINDYIRPALHGHLEAPFVNAYRKPVTALTNAFAVAKPAKYVGGAARAVVSKVPGGSQLLGTIDSAAQLPSKAATAFGKKAADVVGLSPVREAAKVLSPIMGHLPADMAQSFRARQTDIKHAWERVPNHVREAIPAAMMRTDANAEALVQTSPEAMSFIHKVNHHEERVFQELKIRGLVSDHEWRKTRLGAQYMAEIADGKRPTPWGARKNLTSQDLSNSKEVADDFDRFVREKAATGEPIGSYVPLVSREEAAYHMARKVSSPIASTRPYDVGAFKGRVTSGLATNPAGFRQLTSGRETSFLQNAFITRLEQADRASALYDWTANFQEQFAKLSPEARVLVAKRVDRVLERAMKSTGLFAGDLKIDWDLAEIARNNPAKWVVHLEEWSADLDSFVEHKFFKPLHYAAQIQRLASVLPDLFFPLYMSAQQAMFLGAQAMSGPKIFVRSLIGAILASDRRVLRLFGFSGKNSVAGKIIPEEFLEHSRILSNSTFDNKQLQFLADSLSGLSRYQDLTTKAVNYFRTAAAISWMLEEFETLNPQAQAHLITALHEQMDLMKTAKKLIKFGRTMRGGVVKEIRHAPGPIFRRVKKLSGQVSYQNKRIQKLEALMRLGEHNISKGIQVEYNKSLLASRQQQLAKLKTTVQETARAKDELLSRYKPVHSYGLDGTKRIKHFAETKELGKTGLDNQEISDFMNRLHAHLDTFYGNYQAQHTGIAKALNTTFVWLNMKIHAVRLGVALHTRYAASGAMMDRLAQFVGEQEKAHAEQQDLPPWAKQLGCWKSQKQSPDGTMLLYAPHGWLLMTEPAKINQAVLNFFVPDASGLSEDDEDLNMLGKAAQLLFSGKRPGKDKLLTNPNYYQVGERQYNPAHIAEIRSQGREPDLESDAVRVAWPNLVHAVVQSLLEGASEKLWSYGKTWNRTLYEQEPSDLSIPLLPSYPKKIGGPFGENQAPAPVPVTSLVPGGNKFAPFSTRNDSRTNRFERQKELKLLRDADEAHEHHADEQGVFEGLMKKIQSMKPANTLQQTRSAITQARQAVASPLVSNHDDLMQRIQNMKPSGKY
jgi:hypothetical protein